MNTKKNKHKNKPKPANPNPPQRADNTPIVEKSDEVIEEKVEIALRNEERVPEIINEALTPPVVEVKVPEGDTPKKPKRNRGKKKVSGKEDVADNQEPQDPVRVLEEIQVADKSLDVKDIAIDKLAEKQSVDTPSDNTDVTAAARKKKNKNKKHNELVEQIIGEQKTSVKEEQTVPPKPDGKNEPVNVIADAAQVAIPPVELPEKESKSAKKKNKKKNRTDSERSDKGEDSVTCTAAFQQLLDAKDETKQSTTVGIPGDVKPIPTDHAITAEVIEKIVEIDANKDATECKSETVLSPECPPEVNPLDIAKDDDGKSKKRSKKDKKHAPKSECEEHTPKSLDVGDITKPFKAEVETKPISSTETTTETKSVLIERSTDIIAEVASKVEIKEAENLLPHSAIFEKENPKLEAKMAKPVEKKHKNKGKAEPENIESDSLCSSTSVDTRDKPVSTLSTAVETPVVVFTPEQNETKLIEDSQIQTDEEKSLQQKEKTEESVLTIENIKIPKTGMGKKRGKSPKPPKRTENIIEASKTDVESKAVTKCDQEQKEEKSLHHEIPIPTPESKLSIQCFELMAPIEDILAPSLEQPESQISKDLSQPKALNEKSIPSHEIVTQIEATLSEAPNQTLSQLKPEPVTTTKSVVLTEATTESPKAKDMPTLPGFGIPLPDSIKELTAETSRLTKDGSNDLTVEEHKPDLMPLPKNVTGKKRNKSPKMPRKLNITPEIESLVEESPKTVEPVRDERKEKTESPTDLPPLEDIEIPRVKSDIIERSDADIVQEALASRSPHQLDTNNNPVSFAIEGVSASAAGSNKLNIPIAMPDTPFIKSTCEMPTTTPEFVPTAVGITEIHTKITKPNEEKTDLKSKVMEVNKDMEVLRLSIERSLAELTAMETSEKETEKQIEQSRIKREETQRTQCKGEKNQGKKKEKKQEDLKPGACESKEILNTTGQKSQSKIEETPMVENNPFQEQKSTAKDTELKQTAFESTEKIKLSKKPETDMEATPTVETKHLPEERKQSEAPVSLDTPTVPPIQPPPRKENRGKNKHKNKGKKEAEHGTLDAVVQSSTTQSSSTTSGSSENKDTSQDIKKEDKSEKKADSKGTGKQQCTSFQDTNFEPIENFEDAMTSSNDDVNKSFEMIANSGIDTTEAQDNTNTSDINNPEISVTSPVEDNEITDRNERGNPVSQPKNLLGHPDIPARLNKTDYKKEKNKTPNSKQATVKIKDSVPVEVNKESKESQTENKNRFLKDRKSTNETITCMTNENEEYIYKYSFRKVFLPNACHVCKRELRQARVPCNFCNLIFYCSSKHKDEDYAQHQALCFAVSTIVHLKDQKHIYAEAKTVTGHDYRLLRMQTIVQCEKVLKRKLVPFEQEALLYPRVCADVACREWVQGKLRDCEGCGLISYCIDNEEHLPKTHQRWCKSYSLYQKLVCYQQTRGRLDPRLPSRVMLDLYQIPLKLNEVLASMYEEKIDMNDMQYAALTQIATAPLTAAYCQQLYSNKMNSTYANGVNRKSSFTIHVVGAELQFEADALNKWEVFFLHLRPDIRELKVVLISPELNPSNLPLDLLGKIKLCENCRQNKRRVVFEFQDKKSYQEYWCSDFSVPDLICAFNPSIQRSSALNGKDTWPSTIKCILKLKVPFIITSYTMSELHRDLARIKECTEVEYNIISEPKPNAFASVRPDRNFISDDEMPLLFKNYCFAVICGAF